jgi:hypothetical protein
VAARDSVGGSSPETVRSAVVKLDLLYEIDVDVDAKASAT